MTAIAPVLTRAEFLKRLNWWQQADQLEAATKNELGPVFVKVNGIDVQIPLSDVAHAAMEQIEDLRLSALNGAE